MRYKCKICGEEFNDSDEVLRIDCNGKYHPVNSIELELNAQNSDYCVAFICNECLENNI